MALHLPMHIGKVSFSFHAEVVGSVLRLQTRRKLPCTKGFLPTTGTTHQSRQNSSSSRQISVGVVGAGRIASNVHIPNILGNHRIQLRWIVENQLEAVQAVQRSLYTEVPFYSQDDLESLLDDSSLAAVFVLTPTPTHRDIVLSALQKGKAVFTEQPTAENVADIRTLYDTAASVGRPLLTGFNRRHDPSYRHVYDWYTEGQLGKLQMCKLTVHDSPKSSDEPPGTMGTNECNILSDLTAHDFDTMAWITKCAEPESIYVIAHAHDPISAEIGQPDVSIVTMKYPDGAICLLDTARESCYGHDSRVELFGSLGMGSSGNSRQWPNIKDTDIGALRKPVMHSFTRRFSDSFEIQLNHFIDCVEGKCSPCVTKEDCVITTRMLEAAVESYKENKVINFQQFLSNKDI